jgi:hypothetical protein
MKSIYLKVIIFLFLFFIPTSALANDLPPKEELCPNNDCRGPITIKLIKEDGSVFEQKNEYLYPIIQSMGITILPGENINITGTFKDNKLVNIRLLKDSDKESPLLTFSFWQERKDMMVLKVVNNSNHDIKYHLAMMPLTEENLFKTSSCPVLAGKMVYESWPHAIYQLLIPEIFIIDTNGKVKCEY